MPTVGPLSPQQQVNSDYLSRVTYTNNAAVPGVLSAYTFLLSGSVSVSPTITVVDKFEVVDVVLRKDGAGAGNTVQIQNGSSNITDAIVFATDKAVTRAGTIDVAQNVLAAGGTLTCVATRSAGTVAGLVTVWGFVRP